MGSSSKGYTTCCCSFKHKQANSVSDHKIISSSALHKTAVLMPISNNKWNHDEVNIRLINSEVALSQHYVQSLIESMLR
jgi:hypothetical protein